MTDPENGEQYHAPNPLLDVLRPFCQISLDTPASNEIILGIGLTVIKNPEILQRPDFKVSDVEIAQSLSANLQGLLGTDDDSDWAALSAIKKSAKDAINPAHFVTVSLLAAEHLPAEGYDGNKVPKPSKNRESLDHKIFRTSIEYLRRFASAGHVRSDKIALIFDIVEKNGGLQNINEAVTDDQLRTDIHLFAMANSILSTFESCSTQEIYDGISQTYRSLVRQFRSGIRIDETGWEILPIGELESARLGTRNGEDKERAPVWDFVDWSRIEALRTLVIDWPNAYMAVASLEGQGDEEYYVAVLPAKLGGLAVEHAIGDNPSSGNAVYAWRAEKGIEKDEMTITWKGVYKNTKRIARALGARRMLHTENIEWNVLDYLTRPESELDKPGYSKP